MDKFPQDTIFTSIDPFLNDIIFYDFLNILFTRICIDKYRLIEIQSQISKTSKIRLWSLYPILWLHNLARLEWRDWIRRIHRIAKERKGMIRNPKVEIPPRKPKSDEEKNNKTSLRRPLPERMSERHRDKSRRGKDH